MKQVYSTYIRSEIKMAETKYNTVMLVDDNELDNFVNNKIIESEKFASKILIHTSAKSALDFLRDKSSSPDELPDIILLDIIMPVMDGFAFLDEFEKLPDSVKKKCKVIMLSTSESFKDLNRANKNKYVYKFLNKPLSEPMLAAINV